MRPVRGVVRCLCRWDVSGRDMTPITDGEAGWSGVGRPGPPHNSQRVLEKEHNHHRQDARGSAEQPAVRGTCNRKAPRHGPLSLRSET